MGCVGLFFLLILAKNALAETQIVIKKGDTLFLLAEKYLHQGSLWKTIWQANQDIISNPNQLVVGMTIRLPQKGVIDQVADGGDENKENRMPASVIRKTIVDKPTAHEWERLPRQIWEFDPLGEVDVSQFVTKVLPLQTSSSEHSKKRFLRVLIESKKKEMFGLIKKQDFIDNNQSVGDTVVIEFYKDFVPQDNQRLIYAIVQEPKILKSSRHVDLESYVYNIDAVVELDEGSGDVRTAQIIFANSRIVSENSFIIPVQEHNRKIKKQPSIQGVFAHLMFPPEQDITLAAQFDHIFLDRGTVDGILEGQLFCAIWGVAELNATIDKSMTADELCAGSKNIGIVQVVHSGENFSLGEVLSSSKVLVEGNLLASFSQFKEKEISTEHIGTTIEMHSPLLRYNEPQGASKKFFNSDSTAPSDLNQSSLDEAKSTIENAKKAVQGMQKSINDNVQAAANVENIGSSSQSSSSSIDQSLSADKPSSPDDAFKGLEDIN